jgi:hypothetical protein
MSLAMYAAPFDDNPSNEISNNKSMPNNKKPAHNKTQRKYAKTDMDNNKVNSVLEEIHNNSTEDDENPLGDFNPPPIPDSAGVSKTIATEQTMQLNKQKNTEMLSNTPQPNSPTDGYFLNSYNNSQGNQTNVDDYYKKILPGYDSNRQNINKQYYTNTTHSAKPSVDQDILLQKLNYMIHLLEEKQDEKTNNVMEEVILYSFLGIFIIFVVDSFARVGKYVR